MAPRTETRLGVCNLCEAICGLQLTLTDGPGHRGARQPRRPAVARAHLPQGRCDRRRVRRPRPAATPRPPVVDAATGETSWQRIGWDEAFDLAADGLAAAVNRHGRNALGIYLGNPNAHSLGSLTHGVALVKSFRTRNKFSATSVDQLPQQFVGWQMFGHQLLLPIPDLDRTVLLPGVRWQPDGLQRVADDRARLPEPAACAEEARRPDGRGRPAPHRDREGRHGAPVRAARAPTRSCCWRCSTCCSTRGWPARRRTSRASTRCAPRSRTSPPSAPSSTVASPPTTYDALAREFAGGRLGRRLRPGRGLHAGVRLRLPLGGQPAQRAHRQPRPRGWRDVHRARPSTWSGAGWSGAGTTTSGGAGCAGCRSSAASCRSPCSARRSRRPARARSGRCSRWPATRCSPPRTGRGLDRALAGLDFMVAVDIYLNETTRHADVILPPTTALERDHYDLVFHVLRGAQHRAVHARRSSPKADGRPARLGDLPRARAAHRRPARHEAAAEEPAARAGQAPVRARPRPHDRAPRHLASHDDAGAAQPTRGRRPRPAAPDHARAAADRGPSGSTCAPALVLADLTRCAAALAHPWRGGLLLIGRRHQRTTTPGCTTPSG